MISSLQKSDIAELYSLGKLYDPGFSNFYDLESYLNNFTYIINIFKDDNIIKGFIIADRFEDYIDIELIFVDKKFRNNNIGTKLVESLLENETIKYIMLEVAENNEVAKRFYENLNFQPISIRKGYYNGIDAIVMRKDI